MADTHGTTITLTRIQVLTSHAAHARFLATVDDELAGYIPRQPQIPSPSAYSPAWGVWSQDGTPVLVVETRHKRYEVYRVDGPLLTEDAAEAVALAAMRAALDDWADTMDAQEG